MADDARPTPVVTIVDPMRRGELVDVLEPLAPRPQITAVQVIATALVLLLAIGTTAAVVQTSDLHRQRQAAREALTRARFGLELFGVASDHRVALVFALGSGDQGRVVATDVTGSGWKAVASSLEVDQQSARGAAVSLSRDVDCTSDLAPPTAARAVLELRGQRRTVDLLAGNEVGAIVRNTAREACGQVGAAKALLLQASAARIVGDHVELDLTMTNRSIHDVRVGSLVVDGVGVEVDPALPLLLPKRVAGARFVLDDTPAEQRTLHLTLRIRECLGIGQVLSDGFGQALLLQVEVTGVGGRSYVDVPSAGLMQKVFAQIRKRCSS